MSKAYFISDVHLGLETREKERAKEDRLLAFLDRVLTDGSELFIVGDLFDAWFEYRMVIPKGFHRVLAKLDEVTQPLADLMMDKAMETLLRERGIL